MAVRDEPPRPPKERAPRTGPRKPGQIGEHEHEEQADQQIARQRQAPPPAEAKPPVAKTEKPKTGDLGKGGGGAADDEAQEDKSGEDDGRSHTAQVRAKGFDTRPALGDFIAGRAEPKKGAKFAEVLPAARTRTADLPEPELRPPIFLSTFEGMRDIYLRTRGRASPKTRELLEGTQLEDLVAMLGALHENEQLMRSSEGRVLKSLTARLGTELGPLLVGFPDPRLREPWRLFLEGWEIWVPEGKDPGIELFWEGEAGDDDDDEAVALLQVLRLQKGELTLETKVGAQQDRITFDGQAYYRLKT